MRRIPVAILGATGAVGQRFNQLLADHPWFEVTELVGKSSAGQRYSDAVNWILDGEPPQAVCDMVVKSLDAELDSPIVFSALPREAALQCEPQFAAAGHIVCSNASAYRMAADVPLVLPDVNAEHIDLIAAQREARGWSSGALIANSNCTTMPVVMALAPLQQFGIEAVSMVSQQAISGAGYPGVSALDILDNIIPFVPGDEDKMTSETLKILGRYMGSAIEPQHFAASATCTRVPVIDGHMVSISVTLRDKPSLGAIIDAWRSFQPGEQVRELPMTPAQSVVYLSAQDRPQTRRDRMLGGGMATSIGRLRECPVMGYKFVAMAHNTIRGAAGSSIQNAELLVKRGYLQGWDGFAGQDAMASVTVMNL